MRYSKGIMWLSDCRIPFVDEGDMMKPTIATRDEFNDYKKTEGRKNIRQGGGFIKESNIQGRFTPNLLVCDDMLNDGVITQYNKTREDKGNYLGGHRKEYVGTTDNDVVKQIKGQFFSDKGSNSRYYDLDKWFDKVIDEIQ